MRQNIVAAGGHGRIKILASWWLGSRETDRKRPGTRYTLQTPNDLLPPTRPHLLLSTAS
jgi:hypothetical protein